MQASPSRRDSLLLPMKPAAAREVSLGYHLTLEAIRSGQGNEYHLGSIAQALFTAMFLRRTRSLTVREGLFCEAKEAVLLCRRTGLATGVWLADSDTCALFGEVLTLFDCQLALVTLSELQAAHSHLLKFFGASLVSEQSQRRDGEDRTRVRDATRVPEEGGEVEGKLNVVLCNEETEHD